MVMIMVPTLLKRVRELLLARHIFIDKWSIKSHWLPNQGVNASAYHLGKLSTNLTEGGNYINKF